MSNIFRIFQYDFKTQKKKVFLWSGAIFGILFFYMILHPTIKDMAQVKVDMMPKELLQLFGMTDFAGLENYNNYFEMIYSLVTIVLSVFSVTFAGSLFNKEEKEGTIEFLASMQVSRCEIFIAKLLFAISALKVIILSAFTAILLSGLIIAQETLDIPKFIGTFLISSFSPFLFMGIAVGIAGLFGNISAGSIGAGVVMGSYFLGYMGSLLEGKADFLKVISPLEQFMPSKVLPLDMETGISFACYFALFLISLVVGFLGYRKRDFKI